MLVLRRPELSDQASVMDLLRDYMLETKGHIDELTYLDWLTANARRELGLYLEDDEVPSIQLVAFEGPEALGFSQLRLRLNDPLRQQGGHIGYYVKPDHRGRGLAHHILSQTLILASQKNLKQILLTCDQNNQASRKVIQDCGGELETCADGIEHYWINLEEK